MDIAPRFKMHDVPEEERRAVGDLEAMLDRLGSLVIELEHSRQLVEHCNQLKADVLRSFSGIEGLAHRGESSRKYNPWKIIAYKNGAILIYEFSQVSRKADSLLKCSKWLSLNVNRESLKKANKAFAASFPEFVKLRNAAAHPAERALTKEDFEKDSIAPSTNSGGRFSLNQVVIDGRYGCTVSGRLVSYILNVETVTKLREVVLQRWDAFANIDVFNELRRKRSSREI